MFDYEGDRVRLVSAQRVDMRVPPSDPLTGYEGQAGFWIELRDARGVAYRKVMHRPVRHDVEVHDPERGTHRQVVEEPRGVFTAVVPDVEAARDLVVMSSLVQPTVAHGPARPLARFDLAQRLRETS